MYFCYIDESGTPQIPGNTSHYVLAGVSIPVSHWKKCDDKISEIKRKYALLDAEIHTGWIFRPYIEQSKIAHFGSLSHEQRRYEVAKLRKAKLLQLQKNNDPRTYKQVRKTYKHTEAYVHLSYDERIQFLQEIADGIGSLSCIRIFAECIDKIHFDPDRASRSVGEQGLEQLVSRFERYMANVSKGKKTHLYGALIHDNNETVSKTHTLLMKEFHRHGTLFTNIRHIIETPLFVNSELTSMVQIADLCAFALRRYFENEETDLLTRIAPRFDKVKGSVVGVRHFSEKTCTCIFCSKNQL